MARLTLKKLIEFINEEFTKYEINYTCVEAYRTYYTSDQYEGGAAKIIVRFEDKTLPGNIGYFNCFYSLKEYQEHMDIGYKMYLKLDRNCILSNAEVELRNNHEISD